jgi:ribosome-binding protein aMBF1 (putative translation factor)
MTILERERRARGLSQTELADHLLYSAAIVSRLETGAISVDQTGRRLRHALETFFGLSLQELLSNVMPKSKPDAARLEGEAN